MRRTAHRPVARVPGGPKVPETSRHVILDVRPSCLIANPASGRGRGGRILPAVRRALAARGLTDVRLTLGPGDERRLAREAARQGMGTIIALGGDGTWGNVARGILESGRDTRLALLAAGTGNDFGHALRLPLHDLPRMVEIALQEHDHRVDVGCVDGIHFLNVAGFGLETSVIEATTGVPLLRGPLLYLATAIPKLFTYQPLSVRVTYDDDAELNRRAFLALIAANGPRFGGGFRVAPGAAVDDGYLDVVTVGDGPTFRRAVLFRRVRVGSHLGQPEVQLRRARALRLAFETAPLIDVDGELVRARSPNVELHCIPAALRVAVPAAP